MFHGSSHPSQGTRARSVETSGKPQYCGGETATVRRSGILVSHPHPSQTASDQEHKPDQDHHSVPDVSLKRMKNFWKERRIDEYSGRVVLGRSAERKSTRLNSSHVKI